MGWYKKSRRKEYFGLSVEILDMFLKAYRLLSILPLILRIGNPLLIQFDWISVSHIIIGLDVSPESCKNYLPVSPLWRERMFRVDFCSIDFVVCLLFNI